MSIQGFLSLPIGTKALLISTFLWSRDPLSQHIFFKEQLNQFINGTVIFSNYSLNKSLQINKKYKTFQSLLTLSSEMQEFTNQTRDAFLYPQILSIQAQKKLLNCSNKNAAYCVCISRSCQKPGLMCMDIACECRNLHFKCHHIILDRVLTSINQHHKQLPNNEVRESFAEAKRMINQMIDQLSQVRNKLQLEENYFGLDKVQLNFIQILNSQKFEAISGKFMSQLQNTFQAQKKVILATKQQFIANFQKYRKSFNQFCQQLKNDFSQSQFIVDSKIVNGYSNRKLIKSWLPQSQKDTYSRLIFRASEHQFKANQFHKYCDNIPNTLLIIKTQFDRIIGGYTPVPWKSPLSNEYESDPTNTSFLFSLSLQQKYDCFDSEYSVCNQPGYGPKFGKGRDLCVADNCNVNYGSYMQFPTSYNLCKNKTEYKNNKFTYQLLIGNPTGNKFKIKQYEVYQIKKK